MKMLNRNSKQRRRDQGRGGEPPALVKQCPSAGVLHVQARSPSESSSSAGDDDPRRFSSTVETGRPPVVSNLEMPELFDGALLNAGLGPNPLDVESECDSSEDVVQLEIPPGDVGICSLPAMDVAVGGDHPINLIDVGVQTDAEIRAGPPAVFQLPRWPKLLSSIRRRLQGLSSNGWPADRSTMVITRHSDGKQTSRLYWSSRS